MKNIINQQDQQHWAQVAPAKFLRLFIKLSLNRKNWTYWYGYVSSLYCIHSTGSVITQPRKLQFRNSLELGKSTWPHGCFFQPPSHFCPSTIRTTNRCPLLAPKQVRRIGAAAKFRGASSRAAAVHRHHDGRWRFLASVWRMRRGNALW